jgi:hypothetical protein
MRKIRQAGSYGKITIGLLALVFFVAGCMRYSMVNKGNQIKVGSAFTVETPVDWSRSKEGATETWTIDGPQLQRLVFFTGIDDGKPLFPTAWGSQTDEMPLYGSGMNALEIQEFIEASLVRNGAHRMAVRDLRPARLGNLEGFRFEFSYYAESGLKYEGFVVGANQQTRLLAILYVGTALHHYGKHLSDAEKVVSSVIVR